MRVCVRRFNVCIRIHGLVYAAKVLEAMKDKFFCIQAKVWNKSHIVWEPLQTFIFQLYKALYGIFQGHTENPKEKHKLVNQRGRFSLNILKSIFSNWGLF